MCAASVVHIIGGSRGVRKVLEQPSDSLTKDFTLSIQFFAKIIFINFSASNRCLRAVRISSTFIVVFHCINTPPSRLLHIVHIFHLTNSFLNSPWLTCLTFCGLGIHCLPYRQRNRAPMACKSSEFEHP